MALILFFFSNDIMGFFTTEYGLINEVRNILFLVIYELVAFSIIFNCNQALVAIGKSVFSFYSVMIKLVCLIFFIILICVVLGLGAYNGSFMALILSDTVICIFAYFTFRWHVSRAKKSHLMETAN